MLSLIEIERHRWAEFRVMGGPAEKVGVALRDLVLSDSPQDAEAAYWRLENAVVVQGTLFDSAEATIPVLLAALTDPISRYARGMVLELLFQIVHSAHLQGELGARCLAQAREGLWLLYRLYGEAAPDERDGIRWVLEVVETRPDRLDTVLRIAGDHRGL